MKDLFEYCKVKESGFDTQVSEVFSAFINEYIDKDMLIVALLELEQPLREKYGATEPNQGLWFKWSIGDQLSTTIWDLDRHLSSVHLKYKMMDKIKEGLNGVIRSYIS